MNSLFRILHDHADAGAFNTKIQICGFLNGDTFVTKAGDVGLVYRMAGIDYEGRNHEQRKAVVHRFEAALRPLDERFRVYQYLLKRRVEPFTAGPCAHPVAAEAVARRVDYLNERREGLYDLDLYLVLVADGLQSQTSTKLAHLLRTPRQALAGWLSPSKVVSLLEDELTHAVARLDRAGRAFEEGLSDSLKPERLGKADAFAFLRRLVNFAPHKQRIPLRYDTHVDYFVSGSPVEVHRSHLLIDGYTTKLLTMQDPPASTFAHVLEDLYRLPGEFIACLEWHPLADGAVRTDLRSRKRFFFAKGLGTSAPTVAGDSANDDASSAATARQIGAALLDMEEHRHHFGECSLTLAIYDKDPSVAERAAASAITVLARHDGIFFEETYNMENAWLAMLPGNHANNLRRFALQDVNHADLSFLFTLDRGQAVSPHLGREALAVFETTTDTPYAFNLHHHDVGHGLILGGTGSGKSFAGNFLLTHAQKYDPFTVVFDVGHSYRKFATLFGGGYLELGLRQSGVTLNPFAQDPTPEHLHFLHGFVRVLMEEGGTPLDGPENLALYRGITNLYVQKGPNRRLMNLVHLVPASLKPRLTDWITGGRYGHLFDHAEDTLNIANVQVFDFEAMRDVPALLRPMFFYLLSRVDARIRAGSGFSFVLVDEAALYIRHETMAAYITEALKTWRKKNAAMWLATQSISDFDTSGLVRTVVESCPTKLFLANPDFERERTGTLFGLNEMELDAITRLREKKQFFLKRPDVSKVLALNVDPRSYWLYTNNASDNQRVSAAMDRYGFAAGLDALVSGAA